MVTFGEYPAYITLGMLIIEYVLGMAAVARGFSQYLAQLLDQSATLFVFNDNGVPIDPMAFAFVMLASVVLASGIREGSWILRGTTVIKLIFIAFIAISGFSKANGSYFTNNFVPEANEWDGVFQGTAAIFFAYVAFDAVCNAVEEVS